jgi:hypothetical protein
MVVTVSGALVIMLLGTAHKGSSSRDGSVSFGIAVVTVQLTMGALYGVAQVRATRAKPSPRSGAGARVKRLGLGSVPRLAAPAPAPARTQPSAPSPSPSTR